MTSSVLCGEKQEDFKVESIKTLLNACSELVSGDGLEDYSMCSAALGIILGTCQMCVRSCHSCTEFIGGSHISTSFQNYCAGRRTAID